MKLERCTEWSNLGIETQILYFSSYEDPNFESLFVCLT